MAMIPAPILRNTPTGVGKTFAPQIRGVQAQKHPHGRGEDRSLPWKLANLIETPPRAWGRPLGRLTNGQVYRNTPTGVGKTDSK